MTLNQPLQRATNMQIQVVNAMGSVVHAEQVELAAGNSTVRLSLPSLPTGTYTVKVQDQIGVYQHRLVIE